MTRHRTFGLTLGMAAVLVCAAPACASANPLLSGYGGPGQGSQAILGSAIVGGGGSGSGGGSGTGSQGGGSTNGGGSSSAQASGLSHSGESGAAGGSSQDGSVGHNGTAPASGGSRGHSGAGATGGTRGRGAGAYPSAQAERAYLASVSQTGGLSASELAYALLALLLLALTAFCTRTLVRTGGPGAHRPLKRRVAGPE